MGKGVQVGLNDLHYALLTKDDETGVTYSAPVKVAGAINAKITPKSNSETLYADDGPAEVATALGEIDVELETKDLDLNTQAALLGHTVTDGAIIRKASDNAPYVALGFKSKKSNGNFRYVWLFKGKFMPPDQEYATQEDKPKFQTPKIKGSFIRRDNDLAWQVVGDEDEAGFSAGPTWFNAVYAGVVDTTAPTVTVTPLDGASTVAVDANIVWTFSKAIQSSLVTSGNFFVMQADGIPVSGTLSINAAQTVVTFDPTNNLAAVTDYVAICTQNVKDTNGNALAATSVTNFTTA
ncbi:hypothetical protein JCM15765_39840 [Paradesulfitobacterium aromaticivorans]